MTLQQCGIAFAGNCAPSAIGVSIPPGASAFIRMVEYICSIACDLVRLSRPALVAASACTMKAAAEMTLTTLQLSAHRCALADCTLKNGTVRFAENTRDK